MKHLFLVIFVLCCSLGHCTANVAENPFTENTESKSLVWSHYFNVINIFNKKIGFVSIKLEKINLADKVSFYKANIITKIDSSFIFSLNNTDETEYFDDNFVPLSFNLNINTNRKYVNVQGKQSDSNYMVIFSSSLSNKYYSIVWITNNSTKTVSVPLTSNSCTAGNIKSIILNNGISKNNKYSLMFLDKHKLKYHKISISTGNSLNFNGKQVYLIHLNLGLFGKFCFKMDEEGGIIEGFGMGIRLIPA
ncbi:MAG: hypothetical protein A2252_03780 [Elusimicrobia bacterium RIFOXYA2_FULL_39_19]|nr:MAG: hypothetical protein A2252_03780 [Elusimicrobia bacterium RIFOXYA2_FULL_39_19]